MIVLKSLAVLLCVVAASSAISYSELLQEEWKAHKLEYNKNYDSVMEDKYRMKIFAENSQKIAEHNQRYQRGLVSYSLKQNQFGDMLHHEVMALMTGFNTTASQAQWRGATFIAPENVIVPDAVDWRQLGAVTEVKYQGQCGSCWAFSATGALEGQHFRKTGDLVSLSEQNLIDCTTTTEYNNQGCNGGFMATSFKYVRDNGGIDTEDTYPYEAKNGTCRYNPNNSGATDVGFKYITEPNEEKLKVAVATVGPVSVGVDASPLDFYSGGVFSDEKCTNSLNHAVLVVGYGTDEHGMDYWLVKNSWSKWWGEEGYIRIARNKGNMCGIASHVVYPIV